MVEMHRIQNSYHGQRGIALFAVMLALLLLTVIGLGMMYSTNTETSINANYKDSQRALYAALAGLQEARDRIQPATGDVTVPTGLPSTSAANIIYILNPRGTETVAPWDISHSNTYPDTELCHENVMGLSGTSGVPCTTIASGSSWYSTLNNYTSTSSVWHLSAPLDTKWTRISLKGNNMSPAAASGDSTNSSQVCWDGHNQVTIPGGYGGNCRPNGSIDPTTLVLVGGAGYTSTPDVTISAPPSGGTQATATATLTTVSDGQVAAISVSNPGAGYTSAPVVQLIGGGGTGATATAQYVPASGAPVTTITSGNMNGTQCYGVAPTVSITGGGGTGATATTTLAGTKSCVSSWTPSATCSSLRNSTVTGVTLSGGGGSSYSGTLVFDTHGHISSSSIQNPGTGYTGNPTTAGGSGLGSCVVTPNAVAGYLVSTVNLTGGGIGYTSNPTVTVAGGAGSAVSPPTATAAIGTPPANAGQVTGITVTANGSGYTSAPTVQITGGGATTNATGTAVLGVTKTVSSINFTNTGLGYRTDPIITIDPPPAGGIPATATVRIGRGPDYGIVYMLTSFAQTGTGARAMAQMEVASPVLGWMSTGALTLDGPSPSISNMPNSVNFVIKGSDSSTNGSLPTSPDCNTSPEPDHPAIDAYDDPNNPTSPSSVATIDATLARPANYTGAGGCPTCTPPVPSVQNGFETLGETMSSPVGLKSMIDAILAVAPSASQYNVTGNPIPGSTTPATTSIACGSPSNFVYDYVNGDATLAGQYCSDVHGNTGYGILVVTGSLTMDGYFNWYGPVLVIGDGVAIFSGGGSGTIVGTMLVAQIWDTNLSNPNCSATILSGPPQRCLLTKNGPPSITWVGGGTNGILYDHCWATNIMQSFPFNPPPSTKPLKILSVRRVP